MLQSNCSYLGVVVVVVVVTFLTHLQSQSAIPLEVPNENAELWPSSSAKNPLSWPNLSGLATFALACELLITPMNVFLSTSMVITFDPTVASSYIYKITALTPGLSGKFFFGHYWITFEGITILSQKLVVNKSQWPWSMLTTYEPFPIRQKSSQILLC